MPCPSPRLPERRGEKVGAILNSSAPSMRDSVLEGLDQEDADFAGEVRKTIFTRRISRRGSIRATLPASRARSTMPC